MHENERIWTPMGGHVPGTLLDMIMATEEWNRHFMCIAKPNS